MSTRVEPLIGASQLAELVYCARQYWYSRVVVDDSTNVHLERGRAAHATIDAPATAGRPRADGDVTITRSVHVASERLGLATVIDVLEELPDGEVSPVEHKVGRCDGVPWDDHRVQVGAQLLLLREAGRNVRRGFVYYRASRRRLEVPLTPELEEEVLAWVERARSIAPEGAPPPPTERRQRCRACRYLGVCLPDEEAFVREHVQGGDARPLAVARTVAGKAHGEELYLDRQGASVSLKEDTLEVWADEERIAVQPLNVLESVVVTGMVHLTTPVISRLLTLGIPVAFVSTGGRFKGALLGAPSRNGYLRRRQALASINHEERLRFSRAFVQGKLHNQRVLLQRAQRRSRRPGRGLERAVALLGRLERRAATPGLASLDALRGVEGAAARLYFAAFGTILGGERADPALRFDRRQRRPPRDPVNALLSYLYALLTSDVVSAIHTVGLDPFVGLLHGGRYGQPSLALDLVEELRPAIADSLALRLVNNGELRRTDFLVTPTGTALTEKGRKTVLAAYADRKASEIVHPTFGYRVTWRRAIELQARLLAKALQAETPEYVPFRIR